MRDALNNQNNSKDEHTATGLHLSHSVVKKEDAIIKTYEEPVLPKSCKIIFISLFVLTIPMILVDIKSAYYNKGIGLLHSFYNITTTGFWMWLILSCFLIFFCLLGIMTTKHNYFKRKKENGNEDHTVEEANRSKRALKRLNRSYYLYIKISLAGLIIWGILYLTTIFLYTM